MEFTIHFLESQEKFDEVMYGLANAAWIGFDTEFVGEKTYIPALCLLQIVVERDIFLIDTLKIQNLESFLSLVQDPAILKITHAGDNDYRLLYILFGIVPQNTFDTQIAAGFVGYNYPAGFAKIVERELGITLSKSHTVADWESRPLDPKALNYAVEDVKFLPQLNIKLTNKLRKRNREAWAREENRKWENPSWYIVDPFKEVLGNDYIFQLDYKERAMLIRLYQWRREKAAELNQPRETVLQSRHISTVLRGAKDGASAFKANRTLPENVWRRFHQEWQELWKMPVSPAEKAFLETLPTPPPEDPEFEWSMELLYHLVRRQCMRHEISPALLLPKSDFNKLKAGQDNFDNTLLQGWRAQLLGEPLTNWLRMGKALQVEWTEDACQIFMKKTQ